jgi:hypothetical protein
LAQAADITTDDLVERVERSPGKIALANLLELRSAYGRGRITPGVLDGIKGRLQREHRIGVLTEESELSQEQEVYIYGLDAPIGELLVAATSPSERGLRRLRDVAEPAEQAVEADENLVAVKAALEDATTALQDYLGENGRS